MTDINVQETVNEYLDKSDWRVNANANQGYSVGGLTLNLAGKCIGNYWLDSVLDPACASAHRSGDIYIHDLDMLAGYCAGWSLRNLLNEGFNGVAGKISSGPPKHYRTALGQMVNFLGTLQNEWAGAQAFSSADTLLAPFVKVDNLTYKEVKQGMQEFIFNMNVPSRWGNQTPFTNLTFDLVCPNDLANKEALIGGKPSGIIYGQLQREMDMVNKAYLEVMLEGDSSGRIFPFPIPTYNITKEFQWDGEIPDLLFSLAAKYGLPYFQNFLNSDMDPSDVRSMCCRLRLDLTELKRRGGGLFGSAEQTGSIGVVTINLPRIGLIASETIAPWDAAYSILNNRLNQAKEVLESRRKFVEEMMEKGLYPYTKRYLGTFRNHFSTIGIIGMHEFLQNMACDYDDTTPGMCNRGDRVSAAALMHFIRERLTEFQEETGHMYNLEATPAEGATHRLAKSDGVEKGYYTNSSQMPVGWTSDPFELADVQDEFQCLYTGGTVLHFYFEEKLSGQSAKEFVKKVLTQYRMPYITLTAVFNICPEHGYNAGSSPVCPVCGNETEVWTRVMGYHRPVKAFNVGKKQEVKDRTVMDVTLMTEE